MSRKAQLFDQFEDGKTPEEVDPLGLKAGTIRKYWGEWDKREGNSGRRQIDHLIPQISESVTTIEKNQQIQEFKLAEVEKDMASLTKSNETNATIFGKEIDDVNSELIKLSKSMSLLEGKFSGQQKLIYLLMALAGGALTWLLQIAFKIPSF